jgi:hypothetical protein
VGRKADYYLKKWRLKRLGQRGIAGFNGAAFLFAGIWLPFRKMYRVSAVFYSIILIESIIEEVVFVDLLHQDAPPALLGYAVMLTPALICSIFGNVWYLNHAHKTVSEIKSLHLDADAESQMIKKRGGVNIWIALLIFAFYLGVNMGVFMLLAELRARISS